MFSYKDFNHQVVGPFAADEIRRLIGLGTILRSTLVRAEGTEFWQPAARFAEFHDLFERIAELEGLGMGGLPATQSGATDQPAIEIPVSITPETTPGSDSSSSPRSPDKPRSDAPPLGATSTETAPEPEAGDEAAPPRQSVDRFFMIGGDGREYGPVSSTQLREWIGQRRANALTRVRREDQQSFSALGSWPEFAEALASAAEPPAGAPPSLDSTQADQLASDIIGRGYNLSIGSCFSRSWRLYMNNFVLLTGTTAVVLILHTVLHSVPAVGSVASVVLGGVFTAGLSMVFLKLIRGQPAEFADLFVGFQRSFVPLMLASTITFILVSAGLFLCLLPGIYLLVAWLFAYPLVFERSLDFWPAMELSRKVVHERWWEVFALTLCGFALFFGGLVFTILIFGVGVFFTAPLAFGAIMFAYEDIFGARQEG